MTTRLRTVWLAAIILFLTAPAASWAQDGLLVTPTSVIFEGRERAKSVTFVNRSTEPQLFRLSMVNHRQHTDGRRELVDTPLEGEYFADPYIRYSPRQIMLPPGEPQAVRFMLRRPNDLPEGEYRSHLQLMLVPLTEEDTADGAANGDAGADDELAIEIKTVFGVSLPVIFHVGELSFEPRISAEPLRRTENGQDVVRVRLSSEGNRRLSGDVFVVNEEGEAIARRRGTAVYVSTPYRDLDLRLPAGEHGNLVVELRDRQNGDVLTSANVPPG